MKWRKEPNDWPDSPVRHYLSLAERDIYHCLRSYAGGENGRHGFVERSEGVPYSIEQLAIRIDVKEDTLQACISRLVDLGVMGNNDGILHFQDWNDEQAVPDGKQKMSPSQREAYENYIAEKFARNHPEFLENKVTEKLVKLANEGRISIPEEGESDGV